ncbi:MAG: ATP-grasp domain-containing protein [Prevotella sp.]|nr:ATP-grasp domain-containing protein [Prevotella sp.]
MKQKKIMFLGGIYYSIPAIEVAHQHGYHVITVDNVPGNIAHHYSDEYHNISIVDKDAVLSLARKLQIDGILSYGVDPGVVSAAYVAEQMHLPFQCSYKSACILQDKSLFRQFLADNGFNVPKAKGYNNVNDALNEANIFQWPIIVKPVDSAGSKGITKVSDTKDLKDAFSTALEFSHSKHFIIEDYLDVLGYQSTADCFTVDGELAYVDYSDQYFDPQTANPFVPTMRIWPTTMRQSHQEYLTKELQRLFTLLKCKTGIYNIETRICTNGKAYIMEVTPRAGGNRLAEIERIGTGIDLIEAEVCNAVNDPIKEIKMPHYDACYMGYTLHSSAKGSYQSIEYEHQFKTQHFIDQSIYIKEGDFIEPLTGANKAIGDILLKFKDRDECDSYLPQLTNYIKIKLK